MKTIINLMGRKRTGKESAYKLMLPYVSSPEEFQFATPLKKFCIETLGLTHAQCYGTSADRETPTKYSWGDIAPWIREKYNKSPDEIMTARSVLQVVGTDLMRQSFYKDIWAQAGLLQAVNSDAKTCWYTDGRFPNELSITRPTETRHHKCIVIRLYRETGLEDSHDSETALDALDIRPNQRSITDTDSYILREQGFHQLSPSLWSGACSSSEFDYLIDNNHTLDDLRENMLKIIKLEGLFVEPSLS